VKLHAGVAASLAALVVTAASAYVQARLQGQPPGTPPAGAMSGVVQGDREAEAGVWVIAETRALPTGFVKIVVTDDRGRFVIPDLPGADYDVWVRGYGLVDSAPVQLRPGAANVTLRVRAARTPQEAARVYPGNYWLSLLTPPAPALFPGTGPEGNGFGPAMLSQNHWINSLKSDCNFCHQLGSQLTRSVGHVFTAKPELKTHAEAWEWRLGTGVRGDSMYAVLTNQGLKGSLAVFADWTERIAKGEVPPAPPRPSGAERNLVLTLWDVGDDRSFMHDEISTDKRTPTVNAGGPIYAVSAGHGTLVVLDPRTHRVEELEIPTRAPRAQVPSRFPKPMRPSLWWGAEHHWANPPYNPSDPHNPMIDGRGRVWMTSKIRPNANPAWCADPSNPFAEWFPLTQSFRQASYYDPGTRRFVLLDTCFSTHHLQFDTDANDTVYFNELFGPVVGWIDTTVFDRTGDERKAAGWCGQVIDTNGDGRITRPWNQAGGADPRLDTQVAFNLYSVIPSPIDDSVWGVSERFPGYLVRLDRGANPPSSCMAEVYRVPQPGFDPRGVDIDTRGVVWTALAGSSHLASFDRRRCRARTGPRKADGSDCPEGWMLYASDGPKLQGTNVPADFHYYNWVDQHNVLGLGPNTPFATGSNSDSLLALDPRTGRWTTLRVPYPLGFYSRGLDGRIDDPAGGWKGRALYANYGTHFVWHIEGGKGTKGKLVKFQLRPDPLAR
jgi:hypothetical protein